jgi:rod shape determining protein RodA
MRLNTKAPVLLISLLITTLGLVTLLSISQEAFREQVAFLVIGILVYLLISLVRIDIFVKNSFALLFICVLLNISALIFGEEIRGSKRWLNLGFVIIQTSEVLKFAFIIFASDHISKIYQGKTNSLIILIFCSLISIFTVFIQPDLGTALIIALILVSLVLMSRISFKILLSLIFCALSAVILVFFSLKDYQRDRLESYFNPHKDNLGINYNVNQAIIAVGSAGVFGKGFGYGTQSHLKFLPEFHTDFIFSSFVEEWGILFAGLMIVFYGILMLILIRFAMESKNCFLVFLNLAVAFYVFWQTMINIGMNLGLFPVTGIPLPFVSAGGSSLIVSYAVLALARNNP